MSDRYSQRTSGLFEWLACTILHRGFYVRRALGLHTTWTDCAKCGRKWSETE